MSNEPQVVSTTRKRWSVRRKWLVGLLLATLLGLVALEGFCRFYLGLGDPPLSIADPQIEYMFKPNMTYRRFGNLVHYNAWSMRSDDFPAHKTNPNELRVMVLGDSVVNGGSLMDQSKIATTLLADALQKNLARPVVVGNISAVSWGPPNLLAYVKRYGFFDADVIVIILSSHDYADAPAFEPRVGVSADFPDRKPPLAIWEALTRYAPRYLRNSSSPSTQRPPADQGAIGTCQSALGSLLQLAKEGGAKVILAQHLERTELTQDESAGHATVAVVAREQGIEPMQFGPAFGLAIATGHSPYSDEIHPNDFGQNLIARLLVAEIVPAVQTPVPHAH